MAGEEKREATRNRDFRTYEDHSKYLTQDPLVEVREYSDHVRVLIEVSDRDPNSISVRPIDESRIEVSFRYRGRNIKKQILLASVVDLRNYEIRVKNGVARISLRKNLGGLRSADEQAKNHVH